MPTDAFLFSWAFFAFWVVANCFESYINYASGFYLTTIIAGFLYAFQLQQRFGLNSISVDQSI